MKYDVSTNFPEQPDSLIYYSDPSVFDKEVIDTYLSDIKSGSINEAIEKVNESDLHYMSADLFNKFELQLKTLQEYLLTKEFCVNPMIHGTEEPTDTGVHYIWIEEAV